MTVRGTLGALHGSVLYTGAVLGTGVLLLPALAVRRAGPASLVSWVALIVLSIPLATIFAALAGKHANSGGVAGFARTAFGPYAGILTGLVFYGGAIAGVPSAATMGAAYVAEFFNGGRALTTGAAVAMLLGIAAVLCRGVRTSGRVQVALIAILVALMVGAVVGALPNADAGHWTPFVPHGWVAVGSAASLLMFAFVGWEAVAPLSAEFRNPRRDIALATTVALVATSVLYLGLAVTIVAVLGPAASSSEVPIADLMTRGYGWAGALATTVAAVVLTGGAINAYGGGAAGTGAMLAHQGALPRWMSAGHEPGRVATRSILVTIALAVAVAIAIGAHPPMLEYTLGASSACFVAVYAFGSAAAWRLLPGRFHKVLAAVSLLFSVVLLVFSGPFVLAPLAMIGLGTALAGGPKGREA